ncbi:hypothetical protein HP467_07185 [Curtobacterium albidum]|uniref:Peptidase M15B domain-containing protein n=1 Tax=Curtobacterium citreum TaxID=2036 RepID=A0A850DTU6_9MICO|nr:M15 family metallopeptidase [Curtobacterium albidum]NUU27895.1 hypothetical protein [Curtobacterium albidum]
MGVYVEGMGWRVGPSSYADLKGVEQYCALERHADQLNSLAFEFDERPESKAAGIRLSVNEAIRSDARQYEFWDDWQHYLKYGTPWAALAAKPLTSRHRRQIGTAFDIGITMPDGTNRAPTADEWAWIHPRAELRGIRHTGEHFIPQEEWHHDAGYPESLAPIPGVRIANTPIAPPVTDRPEEDEVKSLIRVTAPGRPIHGLVAFLLDSRVIRTSTDTEIYQLGRALGLVPPNEKWSDHVTQELAEAEFLAYEQNTKDFQQELGRRAWTHTFNSGETAGVVLTKMPSKVWGFQFSDGRTAGVWLKNIIGAAVSALVPAKAPTPTISTTEKKDA